VAEFLDADRARASSHAVIAMRLAVTPLTDLASGVLEFLQTGRTGIEEACSESI